MELVATEEKKKIFRAKKTMKMSDRLQLESLHSTLLTTASRLSNPSPPPLVNGTHKEDGQKGADKEQNNTVDRSSPHTGSPSTPTPTSSPAPFLSLNLSPSTASSQSPNTPEEVTSPISPFHSEFPDVNKTKEVEKKSSSPSQSNESVTSVPSKSNTIPVEGKKEKQSPTEEPAEDSGKDVVLCAPVPSAVSDCIEPMDIESDTTSTNDSMASTSAAKDEKPSCPVVVATSSSLSATSPPASDKDLKQTGEIKDEVKEVDNKPIVETGSEREEKTEVFQIKSEVKKKKKENGETTKPSRPSSTPPSDAEKEKSSSSGLKRTLSEGNENDEPTVKKEGKRPKVEHEELEAQLELKITAKAGNKHKLEKMIQQIVSERLKILELTIFDKHFQELKDRVDKIDCANKHQTAITALQSKIHRLTKKFGEANQVSENKKKEEALAAAAAAAAAASAAATAAATAFKTTTVTNNPQTQRPVQTSTEVKQSPTVSSSSTAVVPFPESLPASAAAPVPAPAPAPIAAPPSTSTTILPQTSILQLITSNSNAVSSLAAGITTQSQPGTLLLKTTPGTGMMTAGQPLVIHLPLSISNGQTGLVNFPVSSLSAASTLTKSKTTPATTTFIIKSPPSTNAASAPTSTVATLPAIQAPAGQVSTAQISLARGVYQGGAGRITTPNAGVSVATVRAPAQSVSVAGALSSASSPATSVPAATGSTAPGTPQGTSLTSKTDNQVSKTASGSGSSGSSGSSGITTGITTGIAQPKAAVPPSRPKGSVIDLTEDDDDVQVTGVKKATVPSSSSAPRPNPVISIPNSGGARSSPKTNQNQNSSSTPQITVHHRPPQESPLKPRTVTTSLSSRSSNPALPALPPAPGVSRLPPEAEQTSPPQQLQLKLVPGQTGIVLSWSVSEVDRTCAAVDSYHLYAFHQDNSSGNAAQQHWKKIGEVNALPLPMACTLTQFQSGSTYYFAVRAKDIYGRFGTFCEPQCTNVISSSSS